MNKQLTELINKIYNQQIKNTNFIPGKSSVPVSGKIYDQKEILLMIEAILKGWWTEEEYNHQFEEELKNYLGMPACLTTNSGSSANLLAFAALTSPLLTDKKINPGDEVITTATAFPTTINPILQYGCVPVFIDVNPKTLNIDVSKLKKALSKKTKAVFLAHTLGNPFNLAKIKQFCKEHNLWLIEDNCDALGSLYGKQKTGSFGDISTSSFYPAHHLTTIEGGAVFTKNKLLYKILRSLRDWGRDCWCPTGKDDTCQHRYSWKLGDLPAGYDHKYIYSHIGYNLKMTDIQAACGLAQLKKLDGFIKKRKKNFELLEKKLNKFNQFLSFAKAEADSEPSWFGFPITIKPEAPFTRTDLLKFLNQQKIASRLVFAGNITKQPYFLTHQIKYRIVDDLKNTDYIMNNTFWIGVYPGINLKMINWIEESLAKFLASYQKYVK